MAVVTGEILREYPPAGYPALHKDLTILRDQIARCKEALSVISASAGAARAESAERISLDTFMRETVAEVNRLRPGSNVRLQPAAQAGAQPLIAVERTIRQALLNVLHNAVDVSPNFVRLTCSWDAATLSIAVVDRGGGLKPGSLERPGISSKEGGLGLGLFLSHAALTQAGGSLDVADNDEGGTTVSLRLPHVGYLEDAA